MATNETVKLTEDGGITKEITRRGAGGCPKVGDEVMAHYTGKLTSGKVFDSSGSRHKPFQFIVGIGQVIKGWDVGFLSMEKGEKAVLTCTGPYAYGEDGAGDDIPPNATLHFEVEMLDFGAPGSGVGKGLTEDQRHGHSHAGHGHSHGDGTGGCSVQ